MEVVSRIARGDIFYYELVVPEGRNLFDIAAAAEQLGLFPAAKFLEAARNPALIRDLDPQAPTLEGYLFPDTYKLSRHTTPDRLCRLMTGKFRDAWRSLQHHGRVHRTVTLASLVEKEGKLADERPRIAAVFENRLRIGMKLDCDPTTIYAALLQQHYSGVIHRSDLDSEHPYNTYRHAGLPPGPIANPGLASMRAVLAPSESDSLYFVARADGSGGHEFSSNIAAHESAVERYRRALRKVSPIKQQLRDYLAANQPAAITEAVWQELMMRLAPVSESYLRDLLRDTGLPFDQPYSGIRQHTFEELEQSLLGMLQVYRDSVASEQARARALLPPPGDRRQGSRQIPRRHPAQHAGEAQRKRKRWRSGCWSGWRIPRSFPRGWTPGKEPANLTPSLVLLLLNR